MFPIPWNKAYRKKDGSLVNIDDAMSGGSGGGSELPDYGIEDAGKVLGVTEEGELAWVEVKGVTTFLNIVRNNTKEINKIIVEEVIE